MNRCPGQGHIDDHQVGLVFQGRRNRRSLRRRNGANLVTEPAQNFFEQQRDPGIVFDEQDPARDHRRASPPAPPSLTQTST